MPVVGGTFEDDTMIESHASKGTVAVEISDLEGMRPRVANITSSPDGEELEIRIRAGDLSKKVMERIRVQLEEVLTIWSFMNSEVFVKSQDVDFPHFRRRLVCVDGEVFVKSQEVAQPITISPWAFLRSMIAIAWSAFRHPWRTTEIDLTTGRMVAPS
jgi:hypothetical protein